MKDYGVVLFETVEELLQGFSTTMKDKDIWLEFNSGGSDGRGDGYDKLQLGGKDSYQFVLGEELWQMDARDFLLQILSISGLPIRCKFTTECERMNPGYQIDDDKFEDDEENEDEYYDEPHDPNGSDEYIDEGDDQDENGGELWYDKD